MKSCPYCGHENADSALSCSECATVLEDVCAADGNNAAPRQERSELAAGLGWSRFCFLALLLVAVSLGFLLSRHAPKEPNYGIVLLNTWFSNGQQFVTLRLDPPGADAAYADLVPADYDGSVQPETFRSSGYLFPEPSQPPHTNYTLRFTAMPKRTVRLPYTPGSYTVSYTPSERAHRVRVGASLPLKGVPDVIRRIRNCYYGRTFRPLLVPSARDPVFIVTDPIANGSTNSSAEPPLKLLSAP
jgi:hypothetical protein